MNTTARPSKPRPNAAPTATPMYSVSLAVSVAVADRDDVSSSIGVSPPPSPEDPAAASEGVGEGDADDPALRDAVAVRETVLLLDDDVDTVAVGDLVAVGEGVAAIVADADGVEEAGAGTLLVFLMTNVSRTSPLMSTNVPVSVLPLTSTKKLPRTFSPLALPSGTLAGWFSPSLASAWPADPATTEIMPLLAVIPGGFR